MGNQHGVFVVGEDVQRQHGRLWIARRARVQEGEESGVVCGQGGVAVCPTIGLEIDSRVAVHARVQVDREIVHRPGREDVELP